MGLRVNRSLGEVVDALVAMVIVVSSVVANFQPVFGNNSMNIQPISLLKVVAGTLVLFFHSLYGTTCE